MNIRCWGRGRQEEGEEHASESLAWLTNAGSLEVDGLNVVFKLFPSSSSSVVPKDSVGNGLSIRVPPLLSSQEEWAPCGTRSVGTEH